MAKITKPLTDLEIRNSNSTEKQYKLFDGAGLSIIIFPNSKKKWRYDYTFNKKRNSISLGGYPTVTLKEARQLANVYNEKKEQGINPIEKKVIVTIQSLEELIKDAHSDAVYNINNSFGIATFEPIFEILKLEPKVIYKDN